MPIYEDNKASSVISTAVEQQYGRLLSSTSVRAHNVLERFESTFDNRKEFLFHLVTMSYEEIMRLRSCGKKTAEEIVNLSKTIANMVNNELSNTMIDDVMYDLACAVNTPPGQDTVTLAPNVDDLLPIVEEKISTLSTRAQRAVSSLFISKSYSLTKVYQTISSASFNPMSVKSVGAGTVSEIMQFLDSLCKYLEPFKDEASVNAALRQYKYAGLLIPESTLDALLLQQKDIGYFPLFALIDAYTSGLDEDSKLLLDNCIRMRPYTVIVDKKDLAVQLNLTRERVRQKVVKLLDSLSTYFKYLRQFDFVEHNPYPYQMRYVNEDINRVEGTNFSLEFVNWVLGTLFSQDVTLIGNVDKTLTSYYEKGDYLCLVPTELCKYCNFKGFIGDVDALVDTKRMDDEPVSLHNLIASNLKVKKDYCEEYYPEIEYACRSIIYVHYKLDIDYGNIIFKANAYKPLPDIIYDLIRTNGSPMTAEQIADEVNFNYPDRDVNPKSIGQNALRHSGVVAIGRSSTYTLSEWHDGEFRGGTIRGIVAECLRQNEPTIVSFKKVVAYVKQYRPTTNEKNVMSNITLEQTGAFTFYFNKGKRYLGLTDNQCNYPIDYFPVINDSKNPEANSVWYPKMYQFVKKNGHFPFTGYSEEETKLNRFWAKQRKKYDAEQLDEHSLEYYKKIVGEFGHLKGDKKEFEWERGLESVKKVYKSGDIDALSDSDKNWLLKNLLNYYKNDLEQWQKEEMAKLLKVMNKQIKSENK